MSTTPPLPEPLRGNESGTFTRHSVSVRLPEIAARVLEENDLTEPARSAVQALIRQIGHGAILPLTGEGPAQLEWDAYVEPYAGMGWQEVPWFFAEYYFYRRILDAIGYWERGLDPFRGQKQLGLEQATAAAAATLATVDAAYAQGISTDILLIQLTDAALWGNQVDLSLWPAQDGGQAATDQHSDRLLIDERAAAIETLRDRQPPPVDIVLDNAGSELVADLLVADMLLRSDLASQVRLHAKTYPVFVSDATRRDVAESIRHLTDSADPHLRSAGERLHVEFTSGRLDVSADPYWVSPLGWRQRPAALEASLADAGLVVVKGDANYRRLLDDRHWDFTTPFAQAVGSVPAPLLALRTIKSEIASGLSTDTIERVGAEDQKWLENGRWAIASFAAG